MNIFSSIWKKAYRKGESAVKLADDAGPMKGVVGVTEYDLFGKQIGHSVTNNLLVNNSKSNIIRLISQGQSPWKGPLDPTKLKVSRMRFGNHNPTISVVPNKLNYYNFYELSSRMNMSGALVVNPGYNPTDNIIQTTTRAANGRYDIPYCQKTTLPYPITVPMPPSHGTLIVEFLNNNPEGSNLIETLEFAQGIYTRRPDGIEPSKIISVGAADTFVNTPAVRDPEFVPTQNQTNTRLIYSYQAGFEGWKLIIDEIAPLTPRFTKLRFKFKIGANNVINSIVPQLGYNKPFSSGSYTEQMAEIPNRYYPNSGQKDYYDILSNPEYRDSESDFVDDFSVTFGTNMAGHLGNGGLVAGTPDAIKYKEAFLFNGLDDMFSHVVLPTTFDKNSTNAFFISWTILAPVN